MTLPLRLLIVDDEAPARRRLADLLQDCALKMPLEIVGEADNGRSALEVLQNNNVDVVLLDIRMPEMDGLETAQHMQRLEHPPAIIFTTAFDAYALKAFEVRAVDYLVKPIRASRLFDALSRVRSGAPPAPEALRELRPQPRTHLSASERGRVHLIPITEVIFFKAELKYVTARTALREYLMEESLSRLEEEFAERFVRVHRNCLVARDAIRGFERVPGGDDEADSHWVVVLDKIDERIDVSRRQQHIVRDLGRGS